jgi:hypothetical protein
MNERGSMLPFMAALIFVGLVVVGLALDVALAAATYRELAFAADVGAEAGAVELANAYGEGLDLDPERAKQSAVAAALGARSRSDQTAVADANADVVCVTVTDRYRPRILSALGVGPETISVEACAVPRRG